MDHPAIDGVSLQEATDLRPVNIPELSASPSVEDRLNFIEDVLHLNEDN